MKSFHLAFLAGFVTNIAHGDELIASDCSCLSDLYTRTNGVVWGQSFGSENWIISNSGVPNCNNACNWGGVDCRPFGGENYVSSLELSEYKLDFKAFAHLCYSCFILKSKLYISKCP